MKRSTRTRSRRCPWFVYVVECADATLYVGIAKCVDLRLTKHNAGRGARYTRSRLPVRLLHSERLANHSTALRREYEVKTWTRSQKIERFGLPCAARIGAANVA